MSAAGSSTAASPYADTRDMYTVHAMFRREFALLPGLVRSVPPKDADRAQVVAGHIELVNLMLHRSSTWRKAITRASKSCSPRLQTG